MSPGIIGDRGYRDGSVGVWECGLIVFWDFLEYLGYAGYQSVCVGESAWSTNPVYSYSVLIYMYYALYTAIYMQPVSSSVCVASMLCAVRM